MRKPLLGILLIAACGGGGGPADDQPQFDAPIGTGTPMAFRFTDLDVREPHIHVDIGGCQDVTDSNPFFTVNGALAESMTMDTDDPPDGLLDLSPLLVFRPLDQAAATQGVQIYFADCTAPASGTSCVPGSAAPIAATATNMTSGSCLGLVADSTTDMYTPEVTTPSGPCFVSDGQTITVNLGDIPITLTDAKVAATYMGSPATGMTSGLMAGFIPETVADTTILPMDLPLIGNQPLSTVLPGGTNNCAAHDDKDTYNGTVGWWFYLNFTAEMVTWSDT